MFQAVDAHVRSHILSSFLVRPRIESIELLHFKSTADAVQRLFALSSLTFDFPFAFLPRTLSVWHCLFSSLEWFSKRFRLLALTDDLSPQENHSRKAISQAYMLNLSVSRNYYCN
jgi:hypothetical protein